jgi:cysteinyl-tRNA synthetase
MKKLNVEYPDEIIRVSEVIPDIIAYIQKIIDNGFAYVTSDGSVYFDTKEYVLAGYPFQEHEAPTGEPNESGGYHKKNVLDFALWKGRQPEDIGFDAEFAYDPYKKWRGAGAMPNGGKTKCYGRPGWHIECSTMINKTLGSDIDIHFGGIDLKFPHHHNERLQANAFYHPQFHPSINKTWSPVFHHVGHLCIEGCKMSKSLKNFTTISDALKTTSPNQFRLMAMTHNWRNQMEFGTNTTEQAKVLDSTIMNFFRRIENFPFKRSDIKYSATVFELHNKFLFTQKEFMTALNTLEFHLIPEIMQDLINYTHTVLDKGTAPEHLIRKISQWLLSVLTVLGFNYSNYSMAGTPQSDLVSDLMKVTVEIRSDFRDLTRDKTIGKESKSKIFSILDKWRDVSLKKIGIVLQDTVDSSLWFSENK